jgi:hypothetical protein
MPGSVTWTLGVICGPGRVSSLRAAGVARAVCNAASMRQDLPLPIHTPSLGRVPRRPTACRTVSSLADEGVQAVIRGLGAIQIDNGSCRTGMAATSPLVVPTVVPAISCAGAFPVVWEELLREADHQVARGPPGGNVLLELCSPWCTDGTTGADINCEDRPQTGRGTKQKTTDECQSMLICTSTQDPDRYTSLGDRVRRLEGIRGAAEQYSREGVVWTVHSTGVGSSPAVGPDSRGSR